MCWWMHHCVSSVVLAESLARWLLMVHKVFELFSKINVSNSPLNQTHQGGLHLKSNQNYFLIQGRIVTLIQISGECQIWANRRHISFFPKFQLKWKLCSMSGESSCAPDFKLLWFQSPPWFWWGFQAPLCARCCWQSHARRLLLCNAESCTMNWHFPWNFWHWLSALHCCWTFIFTAKVLQIETESPIEAKFFPSQSKSKLDRPSRQKHGFEQSKQHTIQDGFLSKTLKVLQHCWFLSSTCCCEFLLSWHFLFFATEPRSSSRAWRKNSTIVTFLMSFVTTACCVAVGFLVAKTKWKVFHHFQKLAPLTAVVNSPTVATSGGNWRTLALGATWLQCHRILHCVSRSPSLTVLLASDFWFAG